MPVLQQHLYQIILSRQNNWKGCIQIISCPLYIYRIVFSTLGKFQLIQWVFELKLSQDYPCEVFLLICRPDCMLARPCSNLPAWVKASLDFAVLFSLLSCPACSLETSLKMSPAAFKEKEQAPPSRRFHLTQWFSFSVVEHKNQKQNPLPFPSPVPMHYSFRFKFQPHHHHQSCKTLHNLLRRTLNALRKLLISPWARSAVAASFSAHSCLLPPPLPSALCSAQIFLPGWQHWHFSCHL